MIRKLFFVALLLAAAIPAFAAAKRQPFYARGAVSRTQAYRGGYRVWIDGARYPFLVPSSQFRGNPFRVGTIIDLGGYYNRAGYYDYYCFDCYRRDSSERRDELKFKRGTVRGKVESIDEAHDTFIIIAEGNDSPVTVRRGEDRGIGRLRVGDYLEVDGEWTRTGYFDALRIDYAEPVREQ
ncbi:MAG TPA: hypothetical protein VKB93_23570 [Thermoanaerobaculia bacterium]|nr:hypothetical protein [Thermoanaerobaculia bacterium]